MFVQQKSLSYVCQGTAYNCQKLFVPLKKANHIKNKLIILLEINYWEQGNEVLPIK